MLIKTDTLKGPALDYAVMNALKITPQIGDFGTIIPWTSCLAPVLRGRRFDPSTNWLVGGPLVERWLIKIIPPLPTDHPDKDGDEWCASVLSNNVHHVGRGSTPLIAAMRCLVTSRFGDSVDIPGGLKNGR